MKKVLFNIMTLFFITATLSSCFKEYEADTLIDREVITVVGLDSIYVVSSGVDNLQITLDVNSNESGELTYEWYYFNPNQNTNSADEVLTMTLISEEKDLDCVIGAAPNSYTLLVQVTNNTTGYMSTHTSSLTVVTEFSRGWFILKDNGYETDLDMFQINNDNYYVIDGSTPASDLLTAINGEPLKGKAVSYDYIYTIPVFDDALGYYTNTTSGAAILASEDMGYYDIATLARTRDLSDLFIAPQTSLSPEVFTVFNSGVTSYATTFVDGGALYTSSYMSGTNPTGMFGVPVKWDYSTYNYRLAPFVYVGMMNNTMFDEISNSFVSVSATGGTMSSLADYSSYYPGTGAVSPSNLGLDMVHMARIGTSMDYAANCIMQDPNTGAKYIYKAAGFTVVVYEIGEITSDLKMYDAETYACSSNEYRLYYAVDNVVYSSLVNVAPFADAVEFTADADEKVAFIKHVLVEGAYGYDDYGTTYYDHIAVATYKGEGDNATYTIRFFARNSGGTFGAETVEYRLTGNGGVPADMDLVY